MSVKLVISIISMLHRLDYNNDGKVNWVDAAAYLTNLCGPYIIIVLGLLAPNIEKEIKTTVITLGAGLAGTTQKQEKREELSEKLLNATISAATEKVRKELDINEEVPSYITDNAYDGTTDSEQFWS